MPTQMDPLPMGIFGISVELLHSPYISHQMAMYEITNSICLMVYIRIQLMTNPIVTVIQLHHLYNPSMYSIPLYDRNDQRILCRTGMQMIIIHPQSLLLIRI